MTRGPRIAYFTLGILGSLLAGVGALATWRTDDFAGHVTAVKGTDLAWGKAGLALAVVSLVIVLATRVGKTEEPRAWAVKGLIPIGVVQLAIGASAVPTKSFIYGDDITAAGREAAAAAGEVLARGPGPVLLVAAGITLVVAAVSGLRWVRAWRGSSPQPSEGPVPEPRTD